MKKEEIKNFVEKVINEKIQLLLNRIDASRAMCSRTLKS